MSLDIERKARSLTTFVFGARGGRSSAEDEGAESTN